MSRSRVVHVLGALDTGGTELRMFQVMREMHRRGFVFDFVNLTGRPGRLAGDFQAEGAVVTPIRLGVTFAPRFWVHLRRTRPKVVETHVALFSGVVLLVARWAGVPVRIAHFHSDGDGRAESAFRRGYRRLMRTLVTRNATCILGVSPSSLTSGYRADWTSDPRARVLANGFNAPRLKEANAPSDGCPVLLSLGRSAPEKNLPRMPEILGALRLARGDARLLLVGPRNEQVDRKVMDAARRTGTDDLIELRPAQSDIASILSAASLLLVTSTREGLPSVVIEAASAGVPVVCSDLPGARWISESFGWVTCLSLDESDDAWAEAISVAIDSRPSAERAAEHFAASPFTMSSHVRVLELIYRGRS